MTSRIGPACTARKKIVVVAMSVGFTWVVLIAVGIYAVGFLAFLKVLPSRAGAG